MASSDFWLSPEARLLADSPSADNFTYDGQGHRLVLPDNIETDSPLPLIVIGHGKTLRLINVKVVHSESLPACLHLSAGKEFSNPSSNSIDVPKAPHWKGNFAFVYFLNGFWIRRTN